MPLADHALVVGIDRYPVLGSLSGAERDAIAFHAWVTTDGGVDPLNAIRIVSSDFPPVAANNFWNELPAPRTIDDFFHAIQAASDANEAVGDGPQVGRRLYMFFSGHGFAPALDRSGVLMANASRAAPMNIAAHWWADRMYEGGWFDEVILFQDACREPMRQADLAPPFLVSLGLSGIAQRRRFYVLSAKNDQLSLEKDIGGNGVRGIFSVTLLEGLRGGARDAQTGEITTGGLMAYLRQNMQSLLTAQERSNPDIAQVPEMLGSDPFVLVAPPSGWAASAAEEFPVRIDLKGCHDARIIDRNLNDFRVGNGAPDPWNVTLPRGFYRVVATPCISETFEIAGTLRPDGTKEVIDVTVG